MIESQALDVVAELRKLSTIRLRCHQLFQLAAAGKSRHFSIHENNLDAAVDFIFAIIQTDYPTLAIPFHSRWRHFEAGGIPRHLRMQEQWTDCDPLERARRHIDLIVVSVLLDAGAGASWSYLESQSSQAYNRSEGLGVASFWMFFHGQFSSDPKVKHKVDAHALAKFKIADLEAGFQVTDSNPLVGLQGRVELLQKLGAALNNRADIFHRNGDARPGNILDVALEHSASKNKIELAVLWKLLIEGLQEIWPSQGRTHWNGVNLGDVWHHPALGQAGDPSALVPFHKLSQWLTYSLLEPLAASGIDVSGCDELTGLPEYRNGGLLIDFGVLVPKNPDTLSVKHRVDSDWIVEWRALTIILLDRLADKLRMKLGLTKEQFPLAKVLEAGTWKAGRRIAAQKRPGGIPPVEVVSDGTVF